MTLKTVIDRLEEAMLNEPFEYKPKALGYRGSVGPKESKHSKGTGGRGISDSSPTSQNNEVGGDGTEREDR